MNCGRAAITTRGHDGSLHLCNWPACRRPVPYDMWGCRTHWFTLPAEIREAILAGWRFGRGRLSPEWRAAHEKALEWIRGIAERAKDSRTITPLPGGGK
jgi:hypothetical protein